MAAANEVPAAEQQLAEVRAEELRVQFEDIMTPRPRPPTWGPLVQNWEGTVSLQRVVKKYLCTPGGRDMLYRTTNQEPIHTLLPRSLRLDLMTNDETEELRRSARDLCVLLSPDSSALSLVLPLRDKHTVAEYQQELQQILEHVMATCKHSLRTLHLSWMSGILAYTAEHWAVVRQFLHVLLNSLDQVTVLRVERLYHLVTDQTLSLLASSQKNLRGLQLRIFGPVVFTAAGVRALTSACTKLEALEVCRGNASLLSPDVVAGILQDLPSLRVLHIERTSNLAGMVRYASNPANPPHGLQWDYLRLQQQHVWGGDNFEPLVTAFPSVQKLDMRPVTDAYSDVVVSKVDSLESAAFGPSRWSLSAQARFFSKFTTLTSIYLIPLHTPLVVDLGVIGMNCLALKALCIHGATYMGSEVDPLYFQKLESLTLSAPRNQPARLKDSFLKLLLSGPRLRWVDLQNVEVADQLMLELCQEEQASQQGSQEPTEQQQQGSQHGVFSQLRGLHVTGQGWPGLCAATVVRLACRAPNLYTLKLSVRQGGGGEAPVRDDLVLSTFFKNHMGSVRYLPVECWVLIG